MRFKQQTLSSLVGVLFLFMILTSTASGSIGKSFNKSDIEPVKPIKESNFFLEGKSLDVNRVVRVAIYDENNLTIPSYAAGGGYHNNLSGLVTILSARQEYEISYLNATDILAGELNTADYDVFAIVDNNPRENIVNLVKDFWLAGGGIIAFDGAASFLCYTGIITPATEGTNGYTTIWNYNSDDYLFGGLHPIATSLEPPYNIPAMGGFAAWNWALLSVSSIGADVTRVSYSSSNPNDVQILAFDPSSQGGRVVHMSQGLHAETLEELFETVRDSVDWLAPKPKGKIAFDMSHYPFTCIDSWDNHSVGVSVFYEVRDWLVGHGFTVDKFYPDLTEGNFTLERLSKYDVIISMTPLLNYSELEIDTIESWVNDGGSLLAIVEPEDSGLFNEIMLRQNKLLEPFGISCSGNTIFENITSSYYEPHPITEGVSSNFMSSYGGLNVSGSAYPIIYDNSNKTNVLVAGCEYGKGRVIATADVNWLISGDQFSKNNNEELILSTMNWLTSTKAEVLIYTDWSIPGNYFKNPLPLALNDLGIDFQLTFQFEYFNYSLKAKDWEMIIVDNPFYGGLENYFDDLIDHIDAGRHLILSTYIMQDFSNHSIWARLGCQHNETFTDEPPVYIWGDTHPIFNQPFDYDLNSFSVGAIYLDDGDTVKVFDNATALAGLTTTEEENQAIIVLRNDEQTLFNSYLIDEFTLDNDLSSYTDNYELWLNEIAFMMRPKLEMQISAPFSVYKNDLFDVRLELTNYGLSDAPNGFFNLSLPSMLETTDPMSFEIDVQKGVVLENTWTFNSITNGTAIFQYDGIYGGFIGTEYSLGTNYFAVVIFNQPTGLNLSWEHYVMFGSGLIILIGITVIIVQARKIKRLSS